MNNVIKENYNLNIIAIIKITNKVYRLKTKDNKFYCLKHIDNDDTSIFSNLSLLNLDTFLIPYLNKNGSYITKINDDNFYLSEWYDDEPILVKEIRMKFFIEEIIKLHEKSLFNLKLNKGHFEDIFIDLERIINEEKNDLEYYLSQIEKKEYKSPSEWLFLLNNNTFQNSLNKSKEYLNKFKDIIKELNEVRVCLNYMNFDYKNIILKSNKIIGSEKIKKGSLINDLYDIFNKSFKNSIDITIYFKQYFNKINLLDYEKYWLLSLIYIPQIEYKNNDEINKIIEITSLLYRINVSEEIEKILIENK